jgi:hypothetical protein
VKSTQETGPDVKESEEEESDAEGEPDVQDGPRYSYGDSDYLFDQEKLHTFELTLSDQNLAYLDSAPALEEYVPGTLTFEGETLPVGIRYKGSVGAWVGCLSGDGFLSTEGEKECTKLSTKVKINWEDSDDTFYEVKNCNFIHKILIRQKCMSDSGIGYFEKWVFLHHVPFTPDLSLTDNSMVSMLSQSK